LHTLEQSLSFLSIQEGMHAILNCTYQERMLVNFHWFQQDPGKGPVQKEQRDKHFIELLGKEKFYSVWNIPTSHPGDSATYFCALQ
uniref:Ig-like domain-containing protein n=1 Tax=Gorilla gorilla gorilla TaxID=9595 RepID=A0A2I2ZW35_GORGO